MLGREKACQQRNQEVSLHLGHYSSRSQVDPQKNAFLRRSADVCQIFKPTIHPRKQRRQDGLFRLDLPHFQASVDVTMDNFPGTCVPQVQNFSV